VQVKLLQSWHPSAHRRHLLELVAVERQKSKTFQNNETRVNLLE
jgi:hypothetical protein